jgi:hypothetical protein
MKNFYLKFTSYVVDNVLIVIRLQTVEQIWRERFPKDMEKDSIRPHSPFTDIHFSFTSSFQA